MANSSDDLADKMQQDFKKRVKFVASSSNNNKQHVKFQIFIIYPG